MSSTASLYEAVTARLIELMEQGVKPWALPWKSGTGKATGLVPANAATGRAYTGINILLLLVESHSRGWSNGWMTFRQANTLGARVRKGEKATTVVFTSFREGKTQEGAPEGTEAKKVPFLKRYYVFNLAQLENLPEEYRQPDKAMPDDDERLDALRNLVRFSGVTIDYNSARACYRPKDDIVEMPPYGSFNSDDAFAATLNHELVHATSHPARLQRNLGKRFGDEAYAMEELVAEMGSAFLCAHLGFQHERESAAYLEHWLKVLKADSRAIFTAAAAASKASDWLREREHVVNGDTPEVERAAA